MAIDSDITIADLVTEALRNAGRTSPTAAQITAGTNFQFRRVKSDIALRSSRHEALKTTAVTVTSDGRQRYSWPTNANHIRGVSLLDGPDEWRGTATAGSTTTITLAASLSITDENDVKGKYIITTGGTGSLQIRQVSAWDNTTKVATVGQAWGTAPASGTTYLIASQHQRLWIMDKTLDWDAIPNPGSRGLSYAAALIDREIWLEHTANKVYVLWWDYYAHLDYLDNTSDVILRHIRQFYTLWSQGLSTWFCQRYDENRYQAELAVYDNLLLAYESAASQVTPMQPLD